MNLVALRWILSSLFTFLFVNGHQTTEQYSRFDLTREQYKVFRVDSSLRSTHVLLIKPNILFALAVIISIWGFQDKPFLVNIPKSLNSLTSSRTVSLKCTLLVKVTFIYLFIYMIYTCTYFLHNTCTTLTCTTYDTCYNTITLVKWNYSWSVYNVIVYILIVRVTNKNFVCYFHYVGYWLCRI